MEKIIRIKNLSKHYGSENNLIKAVDNVNLEIEKGENVAIMGKSGSGKSTLLHMIGGIEIPSSGEIIVDNINIACMSDAELSKFRRKKVSFIFQAYNLIMSLNVWENIVLPLGLDGCKPDIDYIEEIMKNLEIDDKKSKMPNTLSGGQQQRVAIARALASHPAVILADEPTGNLDSTTSENVIKLLKRSIKKYGQTLILITHNEDIAKESDRIISIKDGKVV